MTNTVSQSSKDTGLMYPKTKSDPAWDLWAETLAPYEALWEKFQAQASLTCLATFSQWWQDANPGGFSAKMLLHLMLWTSKPTWLCSDTIVLLSKQTLLLLRAKIGFVNSWLHLIEKKVPKISRFWYKKKSIKKLIRRSHKTSHPLTVLIPETEPARLAKITFMVDQSGDYEALHTLSGSLFKDGLLDGLTEYLTRLANE